tara:strand:- start:123 stop:263 length:141 start_codon:yes stop_codon:yes gene_type:complete
MIADRQEDIVYTPSPLLARAKKKFVFKKTFLKKRFARAAKSLKTIF